MTRNEISQPQLNVRVFERHAASGVPGRVHSVTPPTPSRLDTCMASWARARPRVFLSCLLGVYHLIGELKRID